MRFHTALLALFLADLLSLLFIGKNWLALFLPLFFLLFVLLRTHSFISPFLLFLQQDILLTLFSAHTYVLYFAQLFALVFFVVKFHSFFTKLSIFTYIITLSTLGVVFYCIEEFLFDLYISFGEIQKEYYLSFEVLTLLTIMHIFLFFLLFFEGSVFFKKD